MIAIALYCTARLAILPFRQRDAEVDADALHVAMGVAMAGMFVPWLSLLPDGVWAAVFAAAAAWFAGHAIRARRGNARPGGLCRHPVPHLIECVAMVYMLLAASGARSARTAAGIAMPGMSGSASAMGILPGLAAVLALFMIGYVVWAADQLTALTRGRIIAAGKPVLAPRLAACYKIAMSLTMGYMLVLML
jgi:hypothetical protein